MDIMSTYGRSIVGEPEQIPVPSDEELAKREINHQRPRTTKSSDDLCKPSKMYKRKEKTKRIKL